MPQITNWSENESQKKSICLFIFAKEQRIYKIGWLRFYIWKSLTFHIHTIHEGIKQFR